MKKHWDNLLPNLPFLVIVWSIGFYTLRQSAKQFNLDKPDNIHNMHLLFLGIAFFFILLPFIKTIKIGKYLELERNIKETKEEVKEFKSEIRQNFQTLNSTVTASIGNLNNQITINLPRAELLNREIEKLKGQSSQTSSSQLNDIKNELLLEDDEDYIMALARTRIKIEGLLRKALNKRQSISNTTNTKIKFLGLNSLFQQYVINKPNFIVYQNSFHYVQEICSAAMHGQKVSREQADKALQIGALIIRELNGQLDA